MVGTRCSAQAGVSFILSCKASCPQLSHDRDGKNGFGFGGKKKSLVFSAPSDAMQRFCFFYRTFLGLMYGRHFFLSLAEHAIVEPI